MAYLPSTSLRVAGRAITTGLTQPVLDKWTGETLSSIVLAGPDEAEAAVAACHAAFQITRKTPAHVRKGWLSRMARGIEADRDDFAELIVREGGKPLRFARAEVARSIATFELAAEEATRQHGEVLRLDDTAAGEGTVGYAHRVPSGPVLAIAPFNFPLNLVAHKVAPALACGAPVLLKPAPQTPLTALALAAVAREAGVPDDVFQVMPCSNEVAEGLVQDARFSVLSFTGSDKVGWHLKALSGKKRVLLELGGNAAVILREDGLSNDALDRIVMGAFAHAGQVCIKVQRLFVPEALVEKVTGALVDKSTRLQPMAPYEDDAIVSSMIDEAAAKRVESWVLEAKAQGAKVLLAPKREGARLSPSILQVNGAGTGLKVVDEEVFGPVLTVHPYKSDDEALSWVNATRFGLQAGLFTDSQSAIDTAFQRLAVGALVINDVPTFRVDSMPYGGVRDSGLGREGVRYAIEEMTERKLLVSRPGPGAPGGPRP